MQIADELTLLVKLSKCLVPVGVAWPQRCCIFALRLLLLPTRLEVLFCCLFQGRDYLVILRLLVFCLLLILRNLLGQELHFLEENGLLLALLMTGAAEVDVDTGIFASLRLCTPNRNDNIGTHFFRLHNRCCQFWSGDSFGVFFRRTIVLI